MDGCVQVVEAKQTGAHFLKPSTFRVPFLQVHKPHPDFSLHLVACACADCGMSQDLRKPSICPVGRRSIKDVSASLSVCVCV